MSTGKEQIQNQRQSNEIHVDNLEQNRQQEIQQYPLHDDNVNILAVKKRDGNLWARAKSDRMGYYPKQTTMVTDFGKIYREKKGLSKYERYLKQRNTRSRLYQKRVNRLSILSLEKDLENEQLDRLDLLLDEDDVLDDKEYRELASFMDADMKHMDQNAKLADKYLNSEDKTDALKEMLARLTQINISTLKLDTDTNIVKNAKFYESLSRQLVAFERLAMKHGFLNTLTEDERFNAEKKLDSLRSIAAYYQIRKEIIKDTEYASHYNDEISMNVSGNAPEERKVLADKLMRSFILGKTMMKLNGVSDKSLANRPEPVLESKYARQQFGGIKRVYATKAAQKDILKNAYEGGEKRAKAHINGDDKGFEDLSEEERGKLGKAGKLELEYKAMPSRTKKQFAKYTEKHGKWSKTRFEGWKEYAGKYISDPEMREYAVLLAELAHRMEMNRMGNGVLGYDHQYHLDDTLRIIERIKQHPAHVKEKKRFPAYFRREVINKVIPYMAKYEAYDSGLTEGDLELKGGVYSTGINEYQKYGLNDSKWIHNYPKDPRFMGEQPASIVAAYSLGKYLGIEKNLTDSKLVYFKDEQDKYHWGVKYHHAPHLYMNKISSVKSNADKEMEQNPNGLVEYRWEWTPDAIRELGNLQLFLALTGDNQLDPSKHLWLQYSKIDAGGAFIYQVSGVRLQPQLNAFDDDVSVDAIKQENGFLPAFDTISMPFLDVEFVERILNMKPEDISPATDDLLIRRQNIMLRDRLFHIQQQLRIRKEADALLPEDQKTILNKEEWNKRSVRERIQKTLEDKDNRSQLFPGILNTLDNNSVKIEGASEFKNTELEGKNLEEYNKIQNSYFLLQKEFDDKKTDLDKILYLMDINSSQEYVDEKTRDKVDDAIMKLIERNLTTNMVREYIKYRNDLLRAFYRQVQDKISTMGEVPAEYIDEDAVETEVDEMLKKAKKNASKNSEKPAKIDEDEFRKQARDRLIRENYAIYLLIKEKTDDVNEKTDRIFYRLLFSNRNMSLDHELGRGDETYTKLTVDICRNENAKEKQERDDGNRYFETISLKCKFLKKKYRNEIGGLLKESSDRRGQEFIVKTLEKAGL